VRASCRERHPDGCEKRVDGRVNFLPSCGEVGRVGDELSDAEVIRASLDEPEVFKALFERHFEAIFGYLARRSGLDAGSDLASEVFVRAFASRRRYEPARADARPWLYGIAANLLHKQRRSETRRSYAPTRAQAPIPCGLMFPSCPIPPLRGPWRRSSQTTVKCCCCWRGLISTTARSPRRSRFLSAPFAHG
jgi:hypothetical protein